MREEAIIQESPRPLYTVESVYPYRQRVDVPRLLLALTSTQSMAKSQVNHEDNAVSTLNIRI